MTWQHVPDDLLNRKDTRPLIRWLRNRGLQMTLLELNTERQRRGIAPPSRMGR